MALFTLLLLTSLSIAFITLAQTEPIIANNQLRASQARALAESGLEQVLWAIVNSTSTGSLTTLPSVGGTAGAPYDGVTFVRVSTGGGFQVTVTVTAATSGVTDAISVLATGTTTVSGSSTTATAKSIARANYVRFPDVGINAPCALCLSGNIELTGSTDMTGSAGGTACGQKYGVWTTGDLDQSGSAEINNKNSSTAVAGTDYLEERPQNEFEQFALTESALSALRSLAKSSGRQYKPTSNGGTYDFSGMPSSGLVFVDSFGECTPNGTSGSGASCQETVATVGPGSFSGTGDFSGWLIIMGKMNTNGNFGGINGFVYVDGDADMGGMGTSGLTGILMVRRRNGITDAKTAGNANVTFSCSAVRDQSPIQPGWSLVKGSYCDNPAGCS